MLGTPSGSPRSLTEHLATLPTLEDLEAEFRAEDPGFDAAMARARDRRYEELLAQVKAGRLSRITAERLRSGGVRSLIDNLPCVGDVGAHGECTD